MSPQTFRHAHASHALDNGASIALVSSTLAEQLPSGTDGFRPSRPRSYPCRRRRPFSMASSWRSERTGCPISARCISRPAAQPTSLCFRPPAPRRHRLWARPAHEPQGTAQGPTRDSPASFRPVGRGIRGRRSSPGQGRIDGSEGRRLKAPRCALPFGAPLRVVEGQDFGLARSQRRTREALLARSGARAMSSIIGTSRPFGSGKSWDIGISYGCHPCSSHTNDTSGPTIPSRAASSSVGPRPDSGCRRHSPPLPALLFQGRQERVEPALRLFKCGNRSRPILPGRIRIRKKGQIFSTSGPRFRLYSPTSPAPAPKQRARHQRPVAPTTVAVVKMTTKPNAAVLWM